MERPLERDSLANTGNRLFCDNGERHDGRLAFNPSIFIGSSPVQVSAGLVAQIRSVLG